jgi:hypothetical protein
MKAVPGGKYCPMHGGRHEEKAQNAEEVRNLRLSKWKGELARLGNSPAIYSLRDEIGVMRLTLQEMVNRCENANELLVWEPNISRLTMNIGRLVKDFHSLEANLGQLLDKQALIEFGGKIIDIICDKIKDEELRKEIAGAILVEVRYAGQEKEDDDGASD